MRGRRHIFGATMVVLMGVGGLFGGPMSRASAADSVKFLLDWLPYGKHAPFYAGVDEGIYKQYGLDVKVVSGKGSGLSIKTVAGKGVDFGHADTGSLILARANDPNLPVKLISMLHHKALFTAVVLTKSGIKSPKELEGKKIGSSVVNSSRIVFPAFAEAAGFDAKKVTWVDMASSSQNASLFSEKVDAIVTYVTQLGPLGRMAKKTGKTLKSFPYADYGLDVYSNGIIAHDDTIKNRGALARRFVIASLEAIRWSAENPSKAVGAFLKRHPSTDQVIAKAQFDTSIDVLLTKITAKTGIGFIDRDKMQRTVDLMLRFNKGLKRKPTANEIFTNELVAVFPKKGKAM